jgi:succinate dehydrogenase/fumarate reductase cytochrome b subunit
MRHVVTRARALTTAALIAASLSSNAFAMGMHNAPFDGFMDCIYTAYWYAFLR